VSTSKPFGISLKKYFYDYDGDWLKFEMTSDAKIEALADNEVYFYKQSAIVGGTPFKKDYLSMNTVTATDPHGYTASLSFTVIISEDNYVVRRQAV
jgi:hypothetical protein